MVQLIHVVPESWKKMFVYFLFHGGQHQEQLCLHSPGILHKRIACLQYHHLVGEKLWLQLLQHWKMLIIQFFLFLLLKLLYCWAAPDYLFFLYWIFSGLVQDCTIFERISVVSTVVHGKTYISPGRWEISWLLYFTDCSTTLSMFFLT